MAQSLISLGANLGNALQTISVAGQSISELFGASNVAFSQLFKTKAVGGPPGQDDFYNAVATIQSNCTAHELWRKLHDLEQSLGRQRRFRWESRRIDLDVLLHDQQRIWTPTFKVPHPRMVTRTFVLHPSREICPRFLDPVTGRTIESLSIDLETATHSDKGWSILVISDNQLTLQGVYRATCQQLGQPVAELSSIHFGTLNRIDWLLTNPLPRVHSIEKLLEHRKSLYVEIARRFQARLPLLIMFTSKSPDPSSIHWEDYHRPWAQLFGLLPLSNTPQFGPDTTAEEVPTDNCDDGYSQVTGISKYMLPADDFNWAAHELLAAQSAMQCPIFSEGKFPT